ncbi:MAG: TauD/TfdA family dioxygenase, partial [Alphaproteobacteria bacterium]|nr:TauD/TfdA family dioxygenase [Alphaproteobacteria bacterium]
MMDVAKITPAIGAEISGVDFSRPISQDVHDAIYRALLDHLVIIFRSTAISPAAHLAFAEAFGRLDEPHPIYPHVEGYENIVLLENDAATPPDTNSWHTDLTFKAEQPFASILVARHVPPVGGDTMWSSCYAAYDRLPDGMKHDLEGLQAIHDLGDFRNSFADARNGKSGVDRLNECVGRFGHNIRPLVAQHPVKGRKFLNFNEAFVNHIVGLTTNESSALKTFL